MGRVLNMAKKLYWKCPRCGAGYNAYDGEIPLKDGICEDCGGTLVKTPYTFHEVICEDGVLDKMMEEYIYPNPQYDAEVYEMWRKRRDGTQSTVFKSQQNANTPKCPICQSTNLKKISTAKKVGKIAMFGIFGMGDNGKTWQCNNCGSKF